MATIGGGGDGVLNGTGIKDKIFGGGGDDRISGFGGNDKLFGGNGKDVLIGGEGNDTLTGDDKDGGTFADTFVFGQNSGKDVITDFEVGKDMLEIAKGLNGINSAEDVLDHATQKGHDVVIDLGGGNKITLKHVNLDDLKDNPDDHFTIG
jgi:Ca2+-binding RTX toxin-like protein